jgi:membrane associated rhomboid family serine protease
MGWEERDYAREESYVAGVGRRPRPAWSARSNLVTILIAINVAVYVLCTMTARRDVFGRTSIASSPIFYWGYMKTDLVLQGQVWRLVTSDYLHWNFTHILFNMIGLYFLGRPVVQVWGPKKFFAVYTICGVLGSVFFMILELTGVLGGVAPDGTRIYGVAAGASGCVLGLLGAAAVMFPQAEIWVYFLFPVKIRTAAIVFAALYAWNVYHAGSNAGGDACHLAGLAFGAWWAWRGDAWWSRAGWRAALGRTQARMQAGSGPAHRVSTGPGSWQQKMDRRAADAETVDRILKKVYDGGIHTLTPDEKQALAEASERLRQDDLHAKQGWQ